MVARSRTRPPTLTSSTCSRTRSQPRSLLSIARLNKARLRARRSTWSRTRIDHTSLCFRGRLLPNEAPFVPGITTRYRRLVAIEHDRLLGTDRALPAPVRRRPAGHSIPGGRFLIETYPWFIGRQRAHAIRIGTLPV